MSLGTAYDSRRNNFDFLRFALASLVLWSHAWPVDGRRGEWFLVASGGQVTGGSIAVDGFFVLSGFLVMQSWCARPVLRVYAAKRLLRIGPALVLALAFAGFVVQPLVQGAGAWAYLGSAAPWRHFASVFVPSFLVTPGAFPGNPQPDALNASLWSLRYEMLCYVVVPVVGLGLHRWRVVVPAILGASTACAIALAGRGSQIAAAAHQLACFSAGMLFYLARASVRTDARLGLGAAILLAATFVTRGFRVVFPLAGGYLLLLAAVSRRLPVQRFGRYGDVSYGLYLFGFPVEQTLRWVVGPALPFWWFELVGFLLTLAVAALSWRLVEAPALARKPR